MFCKNFPVKQYFKFLKPMSHAGVTMRQLDTPEFIGNFHVSVGMAMTEPHTYSK